MTRKHYDSETRRWLDCSADIRECPYIHASSQKEQDEIMTMLYGSNVMSGASRSSATDTSNDDYIGGELGRYVDVDLLNRMIQEGYVSQQTHPDDDTLRVLCYTKSTQYAAKWNDATKTARGLIVQSSDESLSDARVVQLPWKKFYTLSQMVGSDGKPGWAFGDEENMAGAEESIKLLNFDAPAEVTDKRDGSMLIAYRHPVTGEPCVATKGSFASDQAIDYTNMIRKDDSLGETMDTLLSRHPGTTFVFEGTGPGPHQIILKYDEDDIGMIGAIDKHTGRYQSTQKYRDIWGDRTVAESMSASTLREALALPPREGKEGVVVRIFNRDPDKQMQVKIKQDDYLALHRAFAGMSKSAIFDLVSTGKYESSVSKIGDLGRRKFDPVAKMFQNEHDKIIREAREQYESLDKSGTRKEIAARVSKMSQSSFVFSLLDGRNPGEPGFEKKVWKTVRKNLKGSHIWDEEEE